MILPSIAQNIYFYSRPYARGDRISRSLSSFTRYFYSRPYARGDRELSIYSCISFLFLLTPLREGRPNLPTPKDAIEEDFYSRPYARGDASVSDVTAQRDFISTHAPTRGATVIDAQFEVNAKFLLTPLREGRLRPDAANSLDIWISTHAPTRGATAIIHKTLAAFCGKLPKKHTISGADCRTIGNSQRKCVWFTGIFCANLPHYSATEGSALKNQRTSRFYKRTPSHCFDPVFI